MSRPSLMIVDAESARTPALEVALGNDGWDPRWVGFDEAHAELQRGLVPDALLVDANLGPDRAMDLVLAMRARKPDLPVLMLSEGSHSGQMDRGLNLQGFLEKQQAPGELAVALRRFRPGGQKLTTEDLFGDLLADLGDEPAGGGFQPYTTAPVAIPAEIRELTASGTGAPATPPPAPKPAAKPAPAPAAAPAPAPAAAKRMDAQDIFGDLLDEVEKVIPNTRTPAAAAPAPAEPPTAPTEPLAPAAQAAPAPTPAPAPEPPAAPIEPTEFTLSGISGVHDPFEWGAAATPLDTGAMPAVALTSGEFPLANLMAEEPAPPVPNALEEYGNYYLLEKIAVGGMAELFKAQQRGAAGFQKIVAIKRILPHLSDNEDFVTMFIDEAKLAAQLTHPNIVQIFDLGKAGNTYYIAMEYVNGKDLRTLLRKAREHGLPFPEPIAAFVTMKVAAALDYAHRKRGFDDRELKLVHRDISPQNVLISSEGAVKLVDFGIAKAATKASHTVAGALKGKLLYMSPEQAQGNPLDNRSDLYSLGLVLFELLTGQRCFQADSELGVLEKVRLGRVQDVTTLNAAVSKEMAAIVGRALQKSVDHRYPSARFLERDLRELLMKQGSVPTEHDIAEYLDALLRGPKERVEEVLEQKFPKQMAAAKAAAAAAALAAVPDDPPTTAHAPRISSTQGGDMADLGTLPGLGKDMGDFGQTRRRKWVGVAIGVVAAALAAVLWIAFR